MARNPALAPAQKAPGLSGAGLNEPVFGLGRLLMLFFV